MGFHKKIFFFLLTFLPIQLGFHFWPDWSMVLGRRVDYLSPTVYLTDIFIFLILFLWIKQKQYVISLIPNTKYIIPVVLFIFANIFFANNKPVAIYKWIKVLEFVGLGWYITKTKPNISHLTYYLSIGVVYSSLIAIGQFLFQHSLGLWILGERTFTADTPGIARLSWCLIPGAWCKELLRPYATFPHPNVLAGYVAAVLPLMIFNQTKKYVIFKYVTIFLSVVALFFTFSRSAWIVGIIAIVFAIARIKNYELGIMRKFLFVFFLFLTFFYSLFMIHNSTQESVIVRQQLNAAAIQMWQSSPLLGVGFGNFLAELPKFLVSRDVYFLQPVHNTYLLLLSELGLVGVGGIVFFVWRIMKYKLGVTKESKSSIHYSLFIILLLGFFDHYPITLQQGQLLFAILLVLQ